MSVSRCDAGMSCKKSARQVEDRSTFSVPRLHPNGVSLVGPPVVHGLRNNS